MAHLRKRKGFASRDLPMALLQPLGQNNQSRAENMRDTGRGGQTYKRYQRALKEEFRAMLNMYFGIQPIEKAAYWERYTPHGRTPL